MLTVQGAILLASLRSYDYYSFDSPIITEEERVNIRLPYGALLKQSLVLNLILKICSCVIYILHHI